MTRYQRFLLVLTATCFFLNSPAILSANSPNTQTEVDIFSMTLEELLKVEITSASKQPEKVIDIPASVIIVTRRDIERYGYDTIADVLRSVPGFFHVYDYDEDKIGVRSVLGGEIVILVNGVVQHTNQLKHFAFPAEIIDRIEIVRGPMSVIYGNGAFLGSINIITNQTPDFGIDNIVSASLSSTDTYKAFMRVAAKRADLKVAVSASIYGTEGIDENYKEMMEVEDFNSIPLGSHTSTDKNLERYNKNLVLYGEIGKFYGQIQFNETINEWYVVTPAFHDGNEETTIISTIMLGYKTEFSDSVSIDAKLTYSTFTEKRNYDFVSEELVGHRDWATKRLEPEIVLSYKPTENLSGVVGLQMVSIMDANYVLDIPAFDLLATFKDDDAITQAVYSQFNYTPTDNIKIVAGIRFEEDLSYKKRSTGREDYPENGVGKVDRDSHVIPRLAFVYSFNKHHIAKLLFGKATRSGSVLDSELIEFDKRETIETLEINYIYTVPNLTLSSSIFKSDTGHLARFFQTFVPPDELVTNFNNSGELSSRGIELAVFYQPTERILLEFSTTYADIDDDRNKVEVGNAPEILAKVKAAYLYRNLTFALTGNYTDKMITDWNIINEFGEAQRIGEEVDQVIIFDANLRYEHKPSNYFVSFDTSNLLDEDIRYPAAEDVPFQKGLIGPERTFTATIGRKF